MDMLDEEVDQLLINQVIPFIFEKKNFYVMHDYSFFVKKIIKKHL
jgi:hypothetical protein